MTKLNILTQTTSRNNNIAEYFNRSTFKNNRTYSLYLKFRSFNAQRWKLTNLSMFLVLPCLPPTMTDGFIKKTMWHEDQRAEDDLNCPRNKAIIDKVTTCPSVLRTVLVYTCYSEVIIIITIYLFIYDCLGSLLLRAGFL